MAVRIRLQRQGRKQRPFYHVVIADSRAPRDGRFIEKIGTYNPMTKPATIELDNDKAFDWLMKGASPSDTTRAILKLKGVLYRKHLARGVQKGAFSQEEADLMYTAFLAEKESKTAARFEQSAKEKEDWKKALSGTAGPIKVVEEAAPVVEEAAEAVVEEAEAVVEEAAEAVVEEVAPVVEEAAEAVVEEAEAVVEAAAETVVEEVAPTEEATPEATGEEKVENSDSTEKED